MFKQLLLKERYDEELKTFICKEILSTDDVDYINLLAEYYINNLVFGTDQC